MPSSPNTLSPCQEEALKILTHTSENVFLTGHAGTGKSFLVRRFLKDQNRKTFPVVASTGAAAVLVGGRTFHSFFGLGIMEGGVEQTIQRALTNRRVVKRLRSIEGVILDEVSMISGPTLRAAETICRRAREKNSPWGGIRIIAVGDFAQLPPVATQGEERIWAFLDESWERSRFHPLTLNTVMRCQDEDYTRLLNKIRVGDVTDEVRHFLNERMRHSVSPEEVQKIPHLFPRRDTAETFNRSRLKEIDNPLIELPTTYTGDDMAVAQLQRHAPISETLYLKKSALIMIRTNDPQYRFVNGTLGEVVAIHDESLVVLLRNKKEIEIDRHTFSLLDPEGRQIATATNFPVSLAYATTIHKAQGSTLDALVCDLRRLWEPGHAYVALSRLRTSRDLLLTGWDDSSIRVDPRVAEFHRSFRL